MSQSAAETLFKPIRQSLLQLYGLIVTDGNECLQSGQQSSDREETEMGEIKNNWRFNKRR